MKEELEKERVMFIAKRVIEHLDKKIADIQEKRRKNIFCVIRDFIHLTN